jgi:hypothetical protein
VSSFPPKVDVWPAVGPPAILWGLAAAERTRARLPRKGYTKRAVVAKRGWAWSAAQGRLLGPIQAVLCRGIPLPVEGRGPSLPRPPSADI